MVTIKSHTDLSQSMILSKILPLESADMMYSPPMLTHFKNYGDADNEQELPNYMVINVRRNIIDSNEFDEPIPIRKGDFPCWSLAALLDALPDRICLDNEKYYLNYKKDKVEYLGPLTWDGQKCIISKANTIVDACVEMIIKLHEQKLL